MSQTLECVFKCLFIKGLHPQNILIMFFYFSWNLCTWLRQRLILALIILSNFYMAWNSYCRWFSACCVQLLVSDHGFNLIDEACNMSRHYFVSKFLQEISIIINSISCLSFMPQNLFNFLLYLLSKNVWLYVLTCYVHVSEWIHTLQLPECQGTPCSKEARNLKFKWLQRDSNPQLLSS